MKKVMNEETVEKIIKNLGLNVQKLSFLLYNKF